MLDELRDTIRRRRCAAAPVSPDGHACDDVQTFFVHLSLEEVADPAERDRLQSIPTGLTIPHDDVERLEVAGETVVMNSPELVACGRCYFAAAQCRVEPLSGHRCKSAIVTPLVQPNPSCNAYSPPPPLPVGSSTLYFSTKRPDVS